MARQLAPSEFAWALSSPFEDERSRTAAECLLSADDQSLSLAGLYPALMYQKGFLHATSHLEKAGANLEKIFIPAATVYRSFPMSRKPLWPVAAGGPCSLEHLSKLLRRHQALLWDATNKLAARLGPERFVLLSGKAMQSLFPDYGDRLGFDTDLWMSGLVDGLDALAILVNELGFELKFARLENIESEVRLVASTFKMVDGFALSVGVLSGGYHSYTEPLHFRAIQVSRSCGDAQDVLQSQAMQAPSLEDLLLMVLTRVQRTRKLQMVNIADVAVILHNAAGEQHPKLDISLLMQLCEKYNSDRLLSLLLALAAERWPGIVPPEMSSWRQVSTKFHLSWGHQALCGCGRERTRANKRLVLECMDARRSWKLGAWREFIDSLVMRRLGLRYLRQQYRWLRRGNRQLPESPGSFLGTLPLCRAASLHVVTAVSPCLGERRGKDLKNLHGADIREAADRLLSMAPQKNHNCVQFRAVR